MEARVETNLLQASAKHTQTHTELVGTLSHKAKTADKTTRQPPRTPPSSLSLYSRLDFIMKCNGNLHWQSERIYKTMIQSKLRLTYTVN